MEKRLKRASGAKDDDTARHGFLTSSRTRMATTVLGLFIALGFALQMLAQRDEMAGLGGTSIVTDCDRLAAHPSDPNKLTPGVAQADVDIPAAKAACIKAHAAAPNDGRILYQLGRTYVYNQEFEQGIGYFRQSDAAGYAQGQFVLGLVLMQGYGTEPDTCGGGQLWVKAARQPHLYAKVYLVNNWVDGLFDGCGLEITEQEMDGLVSMAGEMAETEREKNDVAQAQKNWQSRKR